MRKKIILTLSLFISGFAAAEDLRMSEIKDRLMGQDVVIGGVHATAGVKQEKLMPDWRHVKCRDDAYVQCIDGGYVSSALRGKIGKVVAVKDVNATFNQEQERRDAFGDPIVSFDSVNPSVHIIVRLNERDTLIGTKGFYGYLVPGVIEPINSHDARKRELESILKKLVGRTIYKIGTTKLYSANASLDDLLDRDARERLLEKSVANLTPLKVLSVLISEADMTPLLKVQLPDGSARVLIGDASRYDLYKRLQSTTEAMGFHAVEKIPSYFSRRELDAIRGGSMFRGMSELALDWSIGRPKDKNDWGLAGKQLIYGSGLYVYIVDDKVYDWHVIGAP